MQFFRHLGFWEAKCNYGHDFFSGTSNVVAFSKISGKISEKKLRDTLKKLYLRHPLLQMIIKEYEKELALFHKENFDEIPILFYEITDEKEVDEYVSQQLIEKFQKENYLWRFVCLTNPSDNQHYFISAFHHAISDGLSSAQFHHELLEIYSGMELENLPRYQNVEKSLGQKNDWQTFLENKRQQKLLEVEPWAFHDFMPLSQRKMRNQYLTISKDQLLKLLIQSRQESTTVHGLLNSVLLKTAAQVERRSISTTLHTPVNLRTYCEPRISQENIGCYIAMVMTNHSEITHNKNKFELARNYRKQLLEEIPKTGFCPEEFSISQFDIAELVEIFDIPGSTKRKYFNNGFGVTNIGVFPFSKRYGDLSLDYFIFCTNHVMGEYVVFLNAVTVHDELHLCFQTVDKIISHEWIEEFINIFQKNIIY